MRLGHWPVAGVSSPLLFAGSVPALSAQTGTIEGTVAEEESQAPLAGADVVLEGTGHSSVTRSDGGFVLNEITDRPATLSDFLQGGAVGVEVTGGSGEAGQGKQIRLRATPAWCSATARGPQRDEGRGAGTGQVSPRAKAVAIL